MKKTLKPFPFPGRVFLITYCCMKKYILAILIAGTLIGVPPASAASIDLTISNLVEDFLDLVIQKDFDAAYQLMSESYKSGKTVQDLKKVIQGTHLSTCTKKKWTETEVQMMGILTDLSGEFSCPNGEVHRLTFQVMKADHKLLIRDISEAIPLKDLQKKIPKARKAVALAIKDLKKIIPWLRADNTKALYHYLSDETKAVTSLDDIGALVKQAKDQKLDLSLGRGKIVLSSGFPSVTDQGILEIQGDYQHAEGYVHFILGYNYQFPGEWKLGGFSFSTRK